MKTFTKTVSMILIAVMCLSLLSTGAYAMDFTLDGSDSFSLGGGNSSFSVANNGDFSLNDGVSPSFSASNDSNFGAGNDSDFSADNSVDNTFVAQQAAPVLQTKGEEDFSLDESQTLKSDAADTKGQSGELLFDDGFTLKEPYTTTMTFSPAAADITVTDTAATDIEVTVSGGNFAGDTFKSLSYGTAGTGDGRQTLSTSAYKIDVAGSKLILYADWLKKQTPATYYFFGERTDQLPIQIICVTVNAGTDSDYGSFTVNPNTYTKYESTSLIKATANDTGKTFDQFVSYGVVPQGSSSGKTVTDYDVSSDGKTLTLGESFLNGLTDGRYDLYGRTSNGVNVKIGTFTIKSGEDGYPVGKWELWPSYDYAWTSGDDPLMFKSNLMAKRQSYPSYTIVPRYGYGAGSIPNNMIDVNQFWDLGDGVFALGTNFLRSLPAGTYTLQVVDYKHLNDCTNVVTFKIGSTLRPIDTDKHVIGSIKNLRFLCDEPVYEVYVGNIPLTYGEDYALSNGNKTITLSFEFLNKRSAGNTYTIKALTYSGTYPSSTFQILSTAQGSASPRTGDESNLGLWAAFLLLSGTAVVVLVPKLRKHDF